MAKDIFDLSDFVQVERHRSTKVRTAKLNKLATLRLPLEMQRELNIDSVARHCRHFFNPKNGIIAIELVEKPEEQTDYFSVVRGSFSKKSGKDSHTGMHFHLRSLFLQHRIGFSEGNVKLLKWDKEKSLLYFDLSPVIRITDRPVRDVEAKEVRALKG